MAVDKHDVLRFKRLRALAAKADRERDNKSLVKAGTNSRAAQLANISNTYGPPGIGIRSVQLTKTRKRKWNPDGITAPTYAFPVWGFFWLVFGMWWVFPAAAVPFVLKLCLSGASLLTSVLSLPMSWRTAKLMASYCRPTKSKYKFLLDKPSAFVEAVPDDVTIEELEAALDIEARKFEMSLVDRVPATSLEQVYNPKELAAALEKEAQDAEEAKILGMDEDEYARTKRNLKHWAVGAARNVLR